jgi:hypothetical protein
MRFTLMCHAELVEARGQGPCSPFDKLRVTARVKKAIGGESRRQSIKLFTL